MIIELFIAGHLFTSAMLHGPPVVLRENIVANNNEYRCLLRNIWWESASEPFIGKLWVAKTTLNRVRSSKFPSSVCKTVYQRKQFSWTHTIKNHIVVPKTELEKQTFKEVELASFISIWSDRLGIDFTNNSKWYHTTTSKPVWRHKLKVTKVVGNHIFYKQRREI